MLLKCLQVHFILCIIPVCFLFFFCALVPHAHAQSVATTSAYVGYCGDGQLGPKEQCEIATSSVPSNAYSTTIAGRNCNNRCKWAPYCGDAVLQTTFAEECDDGNNTDGDYCASDCTEEEADAGGGSSGGGGSSSSGGSDTPMGDTMIIASGKAYPNSDVNVLIDGDLVGSVNADSSGEFTFSIEAVPGATTVGFWAEDDNDIRSTVFTTTFDVTQGVVTNVNNVLIPPTITADNVNADPGSIVTLSGQTIPNVTVEVSVDDGASTLTTTSDGSGDWTIPFDTGTVSVDTHTVKARFISGSSSLTTESSYGTVLSLFVGVEGQVVSNSDLSRDGRINLTDFSILIYWWGSNGGDSNPPADINGNGTVGLADFSIQLFNWTG